MGLVVRDSDLSNCWQIVNTSKQSVFSLRKFCVCERGECCSYSCNRTVPQPRRLFERFFWPRFDQVLTSACLGASALDVVTCSMEISEISEKVIIRVEAAIFLGAVHSYAVGIAAGVAVLPDIALSDTICLRIFPILALATTPQCDFAVIFVDVTAVDRRPLRLAQLRVELGLSHLACAHSLREALLRLQQLPTHAVVPLLGIALLRSECAAPVLLSVWWFFGFLPFVVALRFLLVDLLLALLFLLFEFLLPLLLASGIDEWHESLQYDGGGGSLQWCCSVCEGGDSAGSIHN